jgi:hypothetical protein
VKAHHFRLLASAAAVAILAACAAAPTETLSENVDPNTGTTVAVAVKVLELVAEKGRGTARDPFAYVGPFETNTQGKKQLFLWLAAPQDKGPLLEPTLMCDDKPLALEPMQHGLQDVGLSQPPYKKPAPWSGQWFYQLSEENLACLAEAKRISLITRREGRRTVQESFAAEGESLTAIAAFAASR